MREWSRSDIDHATPAGYCWRHISSTTLPKCACGISLRWCFRCFLSDISFSLCAMILLYFLWYIFVGRCVFYNITAQYAVSSRVVACELVLPLLSSSERNRFNEYCYDRHRMCFPNDYPSTCLYL